jgi:hypothetical protein
MILVENVVSSILIQEMLREKPSSWSAHSSLQWRQAQTHCEQLRPLHIWWLVQKI